MDVSTIAQNLCDHGDLIQRGDGTLQQSICLVDQKVLSRWKYRSISIRNPDIAAGTPLRHLPVLPGRMVAIFRMVWWIIGF